MLARHQIGIINAVVDRADDQARGYPRQHVALLPDLTLRSAARLPARTTCAVGVLPAHRRPFIVEERTPAQRR